MIKKIVFLILLCFIAYMVLPLFSNESAKPQGQFRAVLIGIDEYKHWPNEDNYAKLNYCVKDIEAIAEVLKKNGYQDENITIIKEERTQRNIYPATKQIILERLKDAIAQCEKDDVILVYFSGHGIRDPKDGLSYLVPYDGRYLPQQPLPESQLNIQPIELSESKHSERLDTLLSMTNITSLLSSCPAKTKYLITDACQSNILKPSQKGADSKVASKFRVDAKDVPAGLIQITSCDVGETAKESETMKHSLFAASLIDGMQDKANKDGDKADKNDDGKVTITELFDYISVQVPEDANGMKKGKQTPKIFFHKGIKGEIGGFLFSFNKNKIESNELKKEAKELLAQSNTEKTDEAKKEKLKSALKNLDQAAKLNPGGEYNYLRDQIETTLNSLTSERIKTLSEEAITYFERKEYDEALEKISAALKLDPNNMHNKAIKKLIETAIDGEPGKQAKKLSDAAWTHYEREEYDEALEKINAALELDPNNVSSKAIKKLIETAMNPPEPPPPPDPKAGNAKTIDIKGIRYTFRWCPAGTFTMGSPESEEERSSDETQHEVTLSKGFWMLETEVTQAMWESVMGTTIQEQRDKSKFMSLAGVGPEYPMYNVNWNEATEFCEKLSELAGIKVTLPTEAQWEYACRAGTTTAFSFGNVLNGDKANCDGNYPYGTTSKGPYLRETTKVRSYDPNTWGLYDMHGNVWEWCSDWKGDYPSRSVTDPTGPYSGSGRVLRGGSWYSSAGGCRSAFRNYSSPEYRFNYLGFRPVLSSSGSR